MTASRVSATDIRFLRSRQVFESLDREGKGFLTAEGIKQVVGLDFQAEEVREGGPGKIR